MSETWSYPSGCTVVEVVSDPATPTWALLELPVLDAATLLALLRSPSPAARDGRVLDRLVALVPWGAGAYRHGFDDVLSAELAAVPELTASQLLTLGTSRGVGPLTVRALSAHPCATAALVAEVLWHVACEDADLLPSFLDASGPLALTAGLLVAGLPSAPGRVSSWDRPSFLSAVDALAPLGESAADVAARLSPDWSGSGPAFAHLVALLALT